MQTEDIRQLAEQRGLTRAFELDPEQVRAVAERAMRPLAPVAGGPTTEPAPGFDPAAIGGAP